MKCIIILLSLISTGLVEDNDFWTGLINPDRVGCYSEAQCLNKVFWISDGAPYDTEVYPDHKLNFNSLQYFCALYSSSINNQQGNLGIDDKPCHLKHYFACEYSCDVKSERIQKNKVFIIHIFNDLYSL